MPETRPDADLVQALARLVRRADGFALAFARVNALAHRRERAADVAALVQPDVRVVEVDVEPETTDLEALLARRYAEEQGDDRLAFFVYGVERVLSSVRTETAFLPVLNYKRENLQRSVPCPVVLWLPEFALRRLALGAPDVWAWRSGVFEFASRPGEADRAWADLRDSSTMDDIARMLPAERQASIETLEELYHEYAERDGLPSVEQLMILADLANRLARLYTERPDYDTAQVWAERSLRLYEETLGPEHPSTLASVNNLGIVLRFCGDLDGAEALHRRELETRERLLGLEHPSTMSSVSNLGVLLDSRGDLDGAEALYRRALETSERVLGLEHPHTLGAINNLGALLYSRGDLDGAEALYRRALAPRERVLGPEHSATTASVNNLGVLLDSRGDLDGAEALYRRALVARERVLGPENPETLTSVNNLGALLGSRGDLDGAEALFRRALVASERVLGPDHPDTKLYRRNLDNVLAERDGAEARA